MLPRPWEAHGADNAKRKEAAASAEAAALRAVASLDKETQRRLRILVHGGTASTDQCEKLARLLGRVGGEEGQHGVMRVFDALHGQDHALFISALEDACAQDAAAAAALVAHQAKQASTTNPEEGIEGKGKGDDLAPTTPAA